MPVDPPVQRWTIRRSTLRRGRAALEGRLAREVVRGPDTNGEITVVPASRAKAAEADKQKWHTVAIRQANRADAFEAERDRLRAALEWIASAEIAEGADAYTWAVEAHDRARAALSGVPVEDTEENRES